MWNRIKRTFHYILVAIISPSTVDEEIAILREYKQQYFDTHEKLIFSLSREQELHKQRSSQLDLVQVLLKKVKAEDFKYLETEVDALLDAFRYERDENNDTDTK